ncbi:MAG: hypothetical protein NTW21_38700 [Verrucomicrobia bacterium]|nr:hypothetical protein [Verrucomicrobiota bacterium]
MRHRLLQHLRVTERDGDQPASGAGGLALALLPTAEGAQADSKQIGEGCLAAWVRFRAWRTLATSLLAAHALADLRRWTSGFTTTRENAPSARFSMRNTLAGVRSPRSSASFVARRLAAAGAETPVLVVEWQTS